MSSNLIGFHDGSDDTIEVSGLDALGAAPPRRPAPAKKAPPRAVNAKTGRAVAKSLNRKDAMATAKAAAERAYRIGKAVSDAGRSTLAKTAKTKVAGAAVILGAAQKKALTPKQKAAADKYEQSIKRSRAAAENAVKRGEKAMARAQVAAKEVTKQAQRVADLINKKTTMKGDVVGAIDANSLMQTFRQVPGDAIVYDGQRGYPNLGFGSWNIWYGNQSRDGFVYANAPSKGNTLQWFARRETKPDGSGGRANLVTDASESYPDAMPAASARYGWGPLIGNPGMWTAGLRFAVDDKQWFWLAEDAPDWATAEARAAIELLERQAAEAEAAAAEAEQAELDRQAAERQREQDEQDFRLAMQEKEEASRAAVEASQQAGQQAQADFEANKRQAEIDAEERRLALEERKAALEYAQQMAQYQQSYPDNQSYYSEEPYYSDEGGGEYGDDPFADYVPESEER